LIYIDDNKQIKCKGDWGTRLQENPQLILQFVIMIQLTPGESSEIRMRLLKRCSTLYTRFTFLVSGSV